jgi:alpha-amylase/alpha-mannosidase (GH57 family)
MAKRPLCVAFLWHMHQPDYRNVLTDEIYLPWTRFHAVKDYYDMGGLAAQEAKLRLNINLVPVLMDQLRAYADGTAQETYADLTLRNAAELEPHEKSFLLRSFFQLPWRQMLLPYPRYKQLLDRRGSLNERGEYSDGLKRYTGQDFRDLQVWFNLAWCGRELRRTPELAAFFQKGSDFTEDDKKALLDIQYRFIGQIIPSYARLAREQGIELSVSPYFHPILPLLCDNRSAREALPDIDLPGNLFAFPEDAREQVTRAQQRYFEEFGQLPAGMWPSEGSISDATASLAADAGLRWLASDDGVLFNSLARERRAPDHRHKFCAYQSNGRDGGPSLFFRNHSLSDLIGFTYSSWNANDAADDFIHKLHLIHADLPDDGRHYIVPIVLDGENAWEHYPENGAEFLSRLYRRLTHDERLRSVTFSEFLELESHREHLKTIVAGSWIYGSLATWIGHPEKNRAWDALAAARVFLNRRRREDVDSEPIGKAYQELLIAEGSDWFWWYGDDHHSENAAEFDLLFRSHLRRVYQLLGNAYPAELDLPFKKADAATLYRDPAHTISPHLDGQVTDYFEWLAAGFAVASAGGAMHRAERYVQKVFFGYDSRHFYIRLDLTANHQVKLPAAASLRIHFVAPRDLVLVLNRHESKTWSCSWLGPPGSLQPPAFGGAKILELGIPLETLQVQSPVEVRFFVVVLEGDRELERFPSRGLLAVPVDPWGLDHHQWMV